jgi:hypothetical protein
MDLNITSDLFEIIFGLLFFVAVMTAASLGND